jgi:glycosyltransferase involved in cell wall biosynthesis
VRVCLVYDHLFPQTIGGTERWMRDLALRLAQLGHDVTYVTMRHWDVEPPRLDGVRLVGVARPGRVYREHRRSFGPPLRFGVAVARHLWRHGRSYDVVHTAAFPYFPLLAAGRLRRRGGYRIVVDWHEVWTRAYWRRYAGRLAGAAGWRVQRACLRVPQQAFCFSRLHERRLRDEGLEAPLAQLEGQYAGPPAPEKPSPAKPVAVFAGRHLPEKRVPALDGALARIPELQGEIYGDGPDRGAVLAAIARHGLEGRVHARGFVEADVLQASLATALCFVLPSEREGYGLVVVESAAQGVPVVVVAGPENAATELIEEGTNGAVAPTAEPGDLAAAIVRVRDAGPALRESTLQWFRRSADRLSLDRSLDRVLDAYGRD